MAINQYLKEIARGKKGSKSLEKKDAFDLFSKIIDPSCNDAEIAAFATAMRMKGETVEEICGFLEAINSKSNIIAVDDKLPVIILPTYGTARKLPNLTMLLALLLEKKGAQVIIHGLASDNYNDKRNITKSIFDKKCSNHNIKYIPVEDINSGLFNLLILRDTLGFRNIAHTLVKMINPTSNKNAIIVGSYTHVDYRDILFQVFNTYQQNAMIMRATEGEPVANANRAPKMEIIIKGESKYISPAKEGSIEELANLPHYTDDVNIIKYMQDAIVDVNLIPKSIMNQANLLIKFEEYNK